MMEVVRHASASQLNVQSVSTLVPTGYTQLLMDRSAVGVQPANTFVLVGKLDCVLIIQVY